MRLSWPLRQSAVLAAAALLALSSAALGVHVQSWTHQKQPDFVDGQFENVVIDNFGELALGREVRPVELAGKADFINCFAQTADGTVYAATSPHGAVYKIQDGKTVLYYSAPGTQDQILSLAADPKGGLLAALCGDGSKVVRLTAGPGGKATATTLFENSAIDYIWAMKVAPDGGLYLATGPHGQIWKVPLTQNGAGKGELVLETGQKNVLALALDGKGNILAGTDGRGLVMRQEAQSKKAFVLLDAGDVDITALATDDAGAIYAATANPDAAPRPTPPQPDAAKPAKPGKVEPDAPPPDDTPDAAPAGKVHGVMPAPSVAKPKEPSPPRKRPADPADEPLTTRNKPSRDKPNSLHLPGEEEAEDSNAVYKISADGTTNQILTKSDMILSLLARQGELLVGTGSEGKLYSYQLSAESEALIARVEQENVTSLFAAADGTVYFGTANTGQIYKMGAAIASQGNYTSPVLDAKQTAQWGSANVMATVPAGAKATIAMRTGNVEDVRRGEKFWSGWSGEIPANQITKIPSTPARFLQYRVSLTAGDQGHTPTVEQVRVAYQVENLPPKIKELTVDTSGQASDEEMGGPAIQKGEHADGEKVTRVSWDASDPNHDDLSFRVYYREADTEEWLPLTRDLKEMEYEWNTQAVADGKYQIKVVATDAPDNTPETAQSTAQVTAPFLVVHTPPAVSELKASVDGNKATVTGTAQTKLCPITEVRYQVDGQADWLSAGALDKIFDSPSEAFTLTTRPLAIGNHKIAVRATDSQGNTGYQSITVSVK